MVSLRRIGPQENWKKKEKKRKKHEKLKKIIPVKYKHIRIDK